MRSVDAILLSLRKDASGPDKMLNPEHWMDAALELNLQIGLEQSELFELQQQVAVMENEEYSKSGKMTAAKNIVRATDLYKQYKSKEARVKNIEEFIRLAKARGKMANGNY